MVAFYTFFAAVALVFSTGCNSLSGGAPSGTSQQLGQGGPGSPLPSPTPTTTGKKRVFITSTFYAGNMGGLSGADALCQNRADIAGLGGVWVSWLSDSQNSAISRIKDASPWYLVNQTTLIFPTFAAVTASGPSTGINMTELGGSPPIINTWTATNTTGSSSTNNCQNWSSASSQILGDIGQVGTGNQWTQDGDSACNLGLALYCFEQ